MQIRRSRDLAAVARAAAEEIAERARAAVEARGVFTLAVSGGSTPWLMLECLASLDVPWDRTHVFQVDERAIEDGHAERNWTRLTDSLLGAVTIPEDHLHPMPVATTARGDERPEATAAAYEQTLHRHCPDGVLDVVQLGLGGDGHTASLVPGDPVLEMCDRDVAWTERAYQGRRRMTLTYPVLDRARCRLWLVAGLGKAAITARLLAGDRSVPAGVVSRDGPTLLFADAEALVQVSDT